MFSRVMTLLATAVLVAGLNSAPAQAATDTWVPPGGVVFNNPVSPKASQRAIAVRRVIAAIDHTPRYGYIRIAAYSFDRKDVADALIRAHKRGARVQMVLNDNWISTQTRRLRKYFGHNPNAYNFVRLCEGSCRGGAGNLHMKVYSFSRTGASNKVLMTGSANMTDRAVWLQWNDLVTLKEAGGLYDTFVNIFNQLKYDQPSSPRWVYYEQPGINAQFYRDPSAQPQTYTRTPSASEDPVMNRLKAINCTAPAPDASTGTTYGINGKTAIRISMYGWNGDRGVWLANQVASMKKAGCNIRIITSVAGGQVVKILHEAGVPIRSADYKYIPDPEGGSKDIVDFYAHLKWMSVDGSYKGIGTKAVWTGSENWSGMSFMNDELCLGLSAPVYQAPYYQGAYVKRFDYMWTKYTHRFGVYPKDKPAYVG